MSRYLLRRVLLALPILLLVSFLTFSLQTCSPYDPVESKYGDALSQAGNDPAQRVAVYRAAAVELKLDKPHFYFALGSAALPDTLHRVFPPARRNYLIALTKISGNWSAVAQYEEAVWQLQRVAGQLPDTLPDRQTLLHDVNRLQTLADPADIARIAARLDAGGLPAWSTAVETFRQSEQKLRREATHERLYWPAFHWYGADNQYHHWLMGVLRADFGLSRKYDIPVWRELYPALAATLALNVMAMLAAYLIAVPLGVALSRARRRSADRWAQAGLLFLYALPVFWIGSILILLFATPGAGFHVIRGIDIESWPASGRSLVGWIAANASKFVLPVSALTLHMLALIALQLRGSMLEVLQQDFIRTARAKGLREQVVYWRHAFRNALFPLIAIFASWFPALFAGSLSVEYLFNFPGMGTKTQQAFHDGDLPVLLAVLLLAAVLTVLGNIIGDVLYARMDPRVRFEARGR